MPALPVTASRPSRSERASCSRDGVFRRHLESVLTEDLRPTQVAVGMRAVAAKRDKVLSRRLCRRKLRRFLEKRPIPAVLGPSDEPYIIDRHHLSLALLHAGVEQVFVSIIDDLSHLPRDRFLARMDGFGWLHAVDADGRAISPTLLPESLRGLEADCYRDLAWSVRQAGGFDKTSVPFSEFRWANFFRSRIPRLTLARDFELAHDKAMWLARSYMAAELPGFKAV